LTKPAGASAPVVKKIPVVPKPEEGQDMKFAEQIKSFKDALEQILFPYSPLLTVLRFEQPKHEV
jgi:hypothetical protein